MTLEDKVTRSARRGASVPWRLGWAGLVLALLGATLPWTAPRLATWAALDDAPAGPGSTAPSITRTRPPYVVEPEVSIRAAVQSDEPRPTRPDPAAGPPHRLIVPSLGVDAPVVGIGVVEGVLLPPADPQTLGWWSAGASPGALTGGALITGHTVHSGGGAFDNLETLDKGARVRVRTARGEITYAVTGVTIYRKASLAHDAAKIFSQKVPGRLVLITCEDWNGSGYDSNAIVFAERVTA